MVLYTNVYVQLVYDIQYGFLFQSLVAIVESFCRGTVLFFISLGPEKIEGGGIFLLLLIILIGFFWRTWFYFHPYRNQFSQTYTSQANFDLIAIGILLFLVFKRWNWNLSKNNKLNSFLCFFGLTIMTLAYFGTRRSDPFSEIFVRDVIGIGLCAFLLGGLNLRIFDSKYFKILSLPGKYCYGIYLFHPTVLFFMRCFLKMQNVFLNYFFFVSITTLIAAVSYHWFEMPVNRLIRKTCNG